MAYTDGVNAASLSSTSHPIQPNITEKDSNENESIISLVNKLSFNISDEDKKQFMSELESIMASSLEQEGDINYHELIDFFIQHTKPNGEISA